MITIETLKSYQDTPESLRLLCLKEITSKSINLSQHALLGQHKLPPELGDLIALAFRDYALVNRISEKECSEFFEQFDPEFTPLTRIDFSYLPITKECLMAFLHKYRNHLHEINISGCASQLKIDDLPTLNALLTSRSLIVGDTLNPMLKQSSYPTFRSLDRSGLFDGTKLQKLVLHSLDSEGDEISDQHQLKKFLTPDISKSLVYLDLSACSIGIGNALKQLESLEILILFNASMTYPDIISAICRLRNLRSLDISRQVIESEPIDYETDTEDSRLLDQLVNSLDKLTRLDISGTNLIGGKDRYIPAFEARLERPFEFLGLFHTGRDAAYRTCIPAQAIAGEANECQMLNACEAYMDRPGQLSKALSDLYTYYKAISQSETIDDVNRALDVVLRILTKHLSDEQVIIFTTAALWCIVKCIVQSKNINDAKVRRTITRRLLDVMNYHNKSKGILINGSLTLLFLPDIICEHSRVAAISLLMCKNSDPRTQGFGTTLLNTLACQVGGDQKIFIGGLNAIEIMIYIINAKLDDNLCDEILETAWSTLWNITDETPVNCRRFLACKGMESFERCMDNFGANKEVLRNMMGLLGNVAECRELRVNFMNERYIRRFHSLLFSQIDGIECSYNACGILAHLISDGESFWDKHLGEDFPRSLVLSGMKNAISRWPINSRRNINYRSFDPIVKLLDTHISAEAQYWAVYALTNLTRINPAKYCPMLLPNNGLIRLRKLTEPGITEPYVQNLSLIAVYQYEKFEADTTLNGLEECTSVDLEVVKNFQLRPGPEEANEWVLL